MACITMALLLSIKWKIYEFGKTIYSRIQNSFSDPWSIQIQITHLWLLSNLINCVHSTPILLNNNKGHRTFYSISNKSDVSGGASGCNAIYATQF